MRKFTLLIASLFITMGAMAQNATTHPDGVYKIHWSWDKRGYLAYHADYPTSPQLAGVVNHNADGHYQLGDAGVNLGWYLYTSPNTGKTYLFEATTGKFITLDRTISIGTTGAIGCKLSEEVGADAQFDLKATTNTPAFMLSNENYNLCSGCGSDKGQNPVRFATDGQGDGGVPFVFVSEGVSIETSIKNAAIAKIDEFEASVGEYAAFYVIKSYYINGDSYLYANAENGLRYAPSPTGEVVSNAVWRFYKTGDTKYAMKNVHTNSYVPSITGNTDWLFLQENRGDVYISDGEYAKLIGGQSHRLHSNDAGAPNTTTGRVKGWEGAGIGNQYYIIEVEAFAHTLSVGSTGYATLCLGFDAEIPTIEGDGNGVFIATPSTVAGNVHLTPITGVLPANTAVIVKAPANTDCEFAYSTSTENYADIDGNLLMGTLYDKTVEGEAYVLGVNDDVVGLYKATTDGLADGSFKNNANKAYLPAGNVANLSAAFYGFDWEGTTGVSEVKGESGNVKVIYDLTGRRVENITAPGIYVVGGRKVLVK